MRRPPATPPATAITKRPTDKTNTGQPPQFPTQAAKTPTDRASRHARESSRPRCHAALRSPPMSSELLARPAQNYWPVRPVLAPRPLSPVQTKVSQLRQRPQSAAPEEQHAAVSEHTHARVRIARDISLTPQQARSSLPGASPARLTTSGHTARHRSAGKTPGCKRSRDHRHRPGAAGASDDRPSSAATRHRVAPHLDP